MLNFSKQILGLLSLIKDRIMFKFFVTEGQRLRDIREVIQMNEDGSIYHDVGENKKYFRKLKNLKRRIKSDVAKELIESLEDERSRKTVKIIDNRFVVDRLTEELSKELQ